MARMRRCPPHKFVDRLHAIQGMADEDNRDGIEPGRKRRSGLMGRHGFNIRPGTEKGCQLLAAQNLVGIGSVKRCPTVSECLGKQPVDGTARIFEYVIVNDDGTHATV